jgi:hypothetical protein
VQQLVGGRFSDSGVWDREFGDIVDSIDRLVDCGIVVPTERRIVRVLLANVKEFIGVDCVMTGERVRQFWLPQRK